MSSINDMLKSGNSNGYSIGNRMKPYSDVHIYPSILESQSKFTDKEKLELTKKGFRWHVYYSYLNPATGKMERQPPIRLSVNRNFPEFDQRRKRIFIIKSEVENLLKQGYSPYAKSNTNKKHSIRDAITFALSIKKNHLEETTYNDYYSRSSKFLDWLTSHGLDSDLVSNFTNKHANAFLNDTLTTAGPRSRNNYKSVLSALFSVLKQNEIVGENYFFDIKPLKANPTRNKSYSETQLDGIISHLEANDPYLLSYIKLFSFNFLRPVELCRLKCSDIDLSEGVLYIRAKNKKDKVKKIPSILIPELSAFDLSNHNHFVFTANDKPGPWTTTEKNKRGYFGKRFLKIKKQLNLGTEYTLYSFRHTYSSKLYRELRKEYNVQESLEKLQLITGHESLSGLKNYLRSIDAELPEDWSGML